MCFSDHAVILPCGKLCCLFVSWLWIVAGQWLCLFPYIGLVLWTAKGCVQTQLGPGYCWPVTAESCPGSALHCRPGRILPACHCLGLSFLICGLCIAVGCSCCFPCLCPKSVSGFETTAVPGDPQMVTHTSSVAQVLMVQARLPPGSDTCRGYLFIMKHMPWSNSQIHKLPPFLHWHLHCNSDSRRDHRLFLHPQNMIVPFIPLKSPSQSTALLYWKEWA